MKLGKSIILKGLLPSIKIKKKEYELKAENDGSISILYEGFHLVMFNAKGEPQNNFAKDHLKLSRVALDSKSKLKMGPSSISDYLKKPATDNTEDLMDFIGVDDDENDTEEGQVSDVGTIQPKKATHMDDDNELILSRVGISSNPNDQKLAVDCYNDALKTFEKESYERMQQRLANVIQENEILKSEYMLLHEEANQKDILIAQLQATISEYTTRFAANDAMMATYESRLTALEVKDQKKSVANASPKLVPSAFISEMEVIETEKDKVKGKESFVTIARDGAHFNNPIAKRNRSMTPFNEDQVKRIISGQAPTEGRKLKTIFCTGLKANRISTIKNLFQNNVQLDLKNIINVDFIGRDICEIVMDAKVVEQYKECLKNYFKDYINFMELDPLDPKLVVHPKENVAIEVTAAIGYLRRLENRIKRPISMGHRKFVEREIRRANTQIKEAKFVSILKPTTAEFGENNASNNMSQ